MGEWESEAAIYLAIIVKIDPAVSEDKGTPLYLQIIFQNILTFLKGIGSFEIL